jgi:hypothetical protein
VQTTLHELAHEGIVEKQAKGVYYLAERAEDAD